jgi:integration host factor subunit alpha
MTKAELVQALQLELDLSRKESVDIVEQFFESIKSALLHTRTVKLSGFGTLEVRYKKPRIGRNPQTREPMPLPARHVLVFRPSVLLKEAMNYNNP